MDKCESKYDLVLDIIEHPDNYTAEQLADILSVPEIVETYNLLVKTGSAVEANKRIDVDAEWENFSKKHAVRSRRSFLGLGSRAASIAVIVGTSIAAVATGIAVTVAAIDRKTEPIVNNDETVTSSVVAVSTDTIIAQIDTVNVDLTPVMFENESLDAIMKMVAAAYGVEVRFNNKEAASLRLYYKLDPALSLDEVVEQLNTFERINITHNGNILNID